MNRYFKTVFFTLLASLLGRSVFAFHNIAWGSGAWLGEYARTWAALLLAYGLLCAALLWLAWMFLWRADALRGYEQRLRRARERFDGWRWLLALIFLAAPIVFFQYAPWGAVFKDFSFRLLAWMTSAVGAAFLLTRKDTLLGWREALAVLIFSSALLVTAVSFVGVNDYPFSQGWSEGNRLWDYSMMFGKSRYGISPEKKVSVLLEPGRQAVGAIPFLLPNLTIQMERGWLALMSILPYLLVGIAFFYEKGESKAFWIFPALWTLLFLQQGPIHPPLVLAAAGVALLWRKPLWLALPLIFLVSYYARISRNTWLFAPALWIFMLEFSGTIWARKKQIISSIARALSLGAAGALGGQDGPALWSFLFAPTPVTKPSAITVQAVVTRAASFEQPLLWERLLPNPTYGSGILFGLLLATLPLILVLIFLATRRVWKLTLWQAAGITLPLTAFLTVGIVISVKIGGGGDLHNLDMFLIGLFFAAGLAWKHGGQDWIGNSAALPLWGKISLVLMIALPAAPALNRLYPQTFIHEADWLTVLADVPDEKSLNMLPAEEDTQDALETIRAEVARAETQGEVLFMDQRQLLTFGYVQARLTLPYEKKVLINEALASDIKYFDAFYKDLAAQRFSLIISPPLHRRMQGEDFVFGEENDAWAKWVSAPLLCYYERKITLHEVGAQLLYPIAPAPDCAGQIPPEMQFLNQPKE